MSDRAFKHAFAITPNNTANLAVWTQAIFVGSAGTIVVDTLGGETNVSFTVPAGATIDVRAIKVKTSGTANNIVGLY